MTDHYFSSSPESSGVVKEIRSVMNQPTGTAFSSPNFEVQAHKLLAENRITQAGFDALLA